MTRTRTSIFGTLARANALALALPFLLAATAAYADPPQPKIVVLDRAAIMTFSKAGQDIAKQMQAYSNQAKNELAARGKALQNDGRNLQQQVAILAPDLKAKKLADFQAREQALQGEVQKKDEQMRTAFAQARQTMEAGRGVCAVGRRLRHHRRCHQAAGSADAGAQDQLQCGSARSASQEKIGRPLWPIPAFSKIMGLSPWRRFAKKRPSPCPPARMPAWLCTIWRTLPAPGPSI